jgi:FkbM family methyltransferase
MVAWRVGRLARKTAMMFGSRVEFDMKNIIKSTLGPLVHALIRYSPFPQIASRLAKLNLVGLPKSPVKIVGKGGVRWMVDCAEYTMRTLYIHGEYESNTMYHLRHLLSGRKQLRVVDVGANIGTYSISLGVQHPCAQILAFEPNPHAIIHLEENVTLNNLTNVEILQFGLGSEDGELELSFTHGNLGTASHYKKKASSETVTAHLTTLDGFLASRGISTIDLIKVDIEGGEIEFLKGARETIERSKNLVIVMECIESVCQRAGHSADDLFNEAANMGFSAFLPRAWPFGLKRVDRLPAGYMDNIIFTRSS